MTLKNSIIAILTTLGIVTATVIGIDQSCGFSAEILIVGDQKVCFADESDYGEYKDAILEFYNTLANKGAFLYTPEGIEFMAVLNHEYGNNKKTLQNPNNLVQQVLSSNQ